MKANSNIFFIMVFLIFPINNIYGYPEQKIIEQKTIIEGIKTFIKQEIQMQYKTADVKSLHIKVLSNRTLDNKSCHSNINYSFPVYSNIDKRATVVAECQDTNGWKVYIPVNIQLFAHALSTKKSLPKLHIINIEDLSRQKINVLQLKDQYYTDPKEIIGLALKCPVKSNTVLSAGLLNEVNYGS